ncbi:MAG: hypothetical protein HY867_06805 [Chloroflexi bacterium]|nr:hypothetical protein [Chloroflexota bacterium]
MLGKFSKWLMDVFKRVWTVNFIFPHVLVPLGALSVYVFSSSKLFPAGVTKAFFVRFGSYLIPTTILAFVMFFILLGIRKIKPNFFNASHDKLSAYDLVLLLLPLTPVAQYILINNDILSGSEAVLLFCLFTLLSSIPIVVIPFLLQRTGAAHSAMSLGLAFTFFITNMASLSKQFSWHEVGRFKIQLMIFCGFCLIAWLFFQLKWINLARLFAAFFFITNPIFQLFALNNAQSATDFDRTDNPLVALIGARKPVRTPNIYLLVYDAYVPNETMLGYGIDNHLQEEYLKGLGFKLYPQTYSLGGSTLLTMSRVFNASPSFYGNNRWRAVAGDGVVQNLFEQAQYETYGVFPTDFFFRGYPSGYGYSFPGHASSVGLLTKAIFTGEFRFDLNFDEVSQEAYFQEKERIFSAIGESPMFLYAHSSFPSHAQTSGVCLPNEVETFEKRLRIANKGMRLDLESVIKNDPNAIIIVAGDHGPHLTKNCSITGTQYDISEISRLDVQDRFGTFLAIRWPSSSDFEDYDDITVLQDLFIAVFAYLYQDTTLLEAKVEPVIIETDWVSGVTVTNGVIEGGINDGEALFIEGNSP